MYMAGQGAQVPVARSETPSGQRALAGATDPVWLFRREISIPLGFDFAKAFYKDMSRCRKDRLTR